MIEPRETWTHDDRAVGRRVLVFDSLPSTNDFAIQCDEPGTAIVAEEQTAGRGQHERIWHSRPGASLNLSAIVAPPRELARPAILIAWAAVAVAKAIHAMTARQVRMKWPNDLLLDGKKVCGILVERQRHVVVGIGLNLAQTADDFTADKLPEATSLAGETGISIDPLNAAKMVLRTLDSEYVRLLTGDRATLESEWKWRIGLLGRQVSVTRLDGSAISGRLADMSFEGIELDAGDGHFEVLPPEHVRAMSAA